MLDANQIEYIAAAISIIGLLKISKNRFLTHYTDNSSTISWINSDRGTEIPTDRLGIILAE